MTVNNTTGNYTISGNGTIGGTGSLTKSGTGTLTLSTPNAYSGGTIVTAGRLVIGQAGTNAVFTGPTLTTANTLTALPTGALSVSSNGIVQLADEVTSETFVTLGAPATSQHQPDVAIAHRQRHARHRQQSRYRSTTAVRDRPDRVDRRVDQERLL